MDGPIYRRRAWWQQNNENKWLKYDKKQGWKEPDQDQNYPFPPPPSRWRSWKIVASEPFQVFVLGILAAIAALGITLALVKDKTLVAAILAPVVGVIGAFTGHAAGHSSAIAVMREKSHSNGEEEK